MDDQFTVGGELMDAPGDPNASAENVINCRCMVDFEKREEKPGEEPTEEPIHYDPDIENKVDNFIDQLNKPGAVKLDRDDPVAKYLKTVLQEGKNNNRNFKLILSDKLKVDGQFNLINEAIEIRNPSKYHMGMVGATKRLKGVIAHEATHALQIITQATGDVSEELIKKLGSIIQLRTDKTIQSLVGNFDDYCKTMNKLGIYHTRDNLSVSNLMADLSLGENVSWHAQTYLNKFDYIYQMNKFSYEFLAEYKTILMTSPEVLPELRGLGSNALNTMLDIADEFLTAIGGK